MKLLQQRLLNVADICPVSPNGYELTPVEYRDGVWLKREDLYEVFGCRGSKARQAYEIISKSDNQVVVTSGSRKSPQIKIVAKICKAMGKRCVAFAPFGQLTEELKSALADGADVVQSERWRHNNVATYHAKEYAEQHGCLYIPFGMESLESVRIVANQVKNVPLEAKRIVIIAGGGTNLCGVLNGLRWLGIEKEVLAVRVGYNFAKTLKRLGPEDLGNLTVVKSSLGYNETPEQTNFLGVELDGMYEAKAIPFIEKGDLFWIIGRR